VSVWRIVVVEMVIVIVPFESLRSCAVPEDQPHKE
jgi:hypothetical protein